MDFGLIYDGFLVDSDLWEREREISMCVCVREREVVFGWGREGYDLGEQIKFW